MCAELIGCFGIVGNIVSILNFSQQGLQDSVNVTLMTLSVSDVGFLLFQTADQRVLGLCGPSIHTIRQHAVFLPRELTSLALADTSPPLPPLKDATNTSNAESVYTVSYFINDLLLPYTSFLALIVCTSFIITHLKSKAKWRHSVTVENITRSSNKVTLMSSKEKKISVMLTTVSVIYVACLTPGCAMLIAVGIVRELKADGAYFNLTMLVLSFTYVLEVMNCSVNTLVYYKMSSKYRGTIQAWYYSIRKHN
ncbi:hypothetical protein Btru_064711 [Bulinus truncatus]|nr:hypothetical protein Btru_064711 [Bulinus truncatus]